MPEDRTLAIEYVPLDDLRRWERNPKEHDVPGLIAAFERFGFVAPLGRNDRTGQLLWGHGRLDALLEMKSQGKPAPPGIRVAPDGGEWYAPVVVGLDLPPGEDAAYSIADNRWVELGGWAQTILRDVLRDMEDINAIGFTEADLLALDTMMGGLTTTGEETPTETEDGEKVNQVTSESIQVTILCNTEDELLLLTSALGIDDWSPERLRYPYRFAECVLLQPANKGE